MNDIPHKDLHHGGTTDPKGFRIPRESTVEGLPFEGYTKSSKEGFMKRP